MRRKSVGGIPNAFCKNGCRWIYLASRNAWERIVKREGCACRSPRGGGDAKAPDLGSDLK